ncbi:NADP-reducing hydrogenase subunit HndA [bioreactor metagenome]|jgi:NADH-quinone oxidoreductase subunit E/NADP-reducing hydrogenase subunit HndA|uniref:NADP-reducing hydrogenase subunit HndA n=1 Tax=bioreactor metagenome TaxID=1076179 RepID=A0A644V6S7_9ZZZZ|nr:NADH-quinone oxidoreductase subunit NuoE [Bacteroidales bacterium]WRQ33676.1 NADH-quinone oxidoreductase subunit NuoE [Bacteroidales bacterium MB20-C3-3]MBP8677325.1 NADH-quinone oxidoreductase subunit NuoE [Bacteroidales bacterium]MBP9584414.1 NADH-quinone oxidoreductase subunit NuoE [Bacteroidales bacterium]MBP9978666.1 NADH-quinone oxidoreductase subunit NuoE [Bacteroidales bacterium]
MSNLKLQECHIKSIHEICDSYKNDPGDLIKILHSAQTHFGYLPESVQREIAKKLKISVAKVYGVVTFYSFFTMTPKGRHAISVCMGTACYVRGAEKVLDELKKQLNIKVGGVTEDGKFSLDSLRCVGACGLAPVLLIGEKVYGRVEPGQIKEILDSYTD